MKISNLALVLLFVRTDVKCGKDLLSSRLPDCRNEQNRPRNETQDMERKVESNPLSYMFKEPANCVRGLIWEKSCVCTDLKPSNKQFQTKFKKAASR